MSAARDTPADNASLNSSTFAIPLRPAAPSMTPVTGTPPPNRMLGSSLRSSTSSLGGDLTSSAMKRRRLSRLERENPDIDPSILAVIDPHKPIGEQIAKIKAATRASSGSNAESPDFKPASSTQSQNMNASASVMSFGSSTMSQRARRQTSGELGKGDHGAIEAMKRKAAEERLAKQRRTGQSRASYAGSAVSDFRQHNYSRVSNSSFGMSRIGLHSSTGSIRPNSSLSNYQDSLSGTSTPLSAAEKLQGLTYVKSVLARKETSQRSRASTPADGAKPESPYASIAAKARGMLAENTKEIQEERVARRKREAMKQEMERERARRDARMEVLAKLAKEEEEEMRRVEEELINAANSRKRNADGGFRVSPDAVTADPPTAQDAQRPTMAKNPRKRSPSAETMAATNEQPAKRTRSSEPDEEVPAVTVESAKPTDRNLMPPPPTPTPSGRTQASANGSSAASSQFSTQRTTPPSTQPVLEKSPPLDLLAERGSPSSLNARTPFTFDKEDSFGDLFVYQAPNDSLDIHNLHNFIHGEGYGLHSNTEPFMGRPVNAIEPSPSIEHLGPLPIIRDFAYSGEPIPMTTAIPKPAVDIPYIPEPIYSYPPINEDEHRGSDTEPDEPAEPEDEQNELEEELFGAPQVVEEPAELEKGEEATVATANQPLVINLLDSDDEDEKGYGADEGEDNDEEEEEEYDDDEEDGEGEMEEEDGSDEEEEDDEEEEENDDEEEEEEDADDSEQLDMRGGFGTARSSDYRPRYDVIEVYSSPPPSAFTEREAEAAESNGAHAVIPDSFVAGREDEASHKDLIRDSLNGIHEKQEQTQEERPVSARSGSRSMSRPSSSHQASQEAVWVRDDDGRLMRSSSPETSRIENGVDLLNSDHWYVVCLEDNDRRQGLTNILATIKRTIPHFRSILVF
ncbi:hypothetical protein Dda_4592 [Drechslerella dactyloides]|uniref:Uncharacterized protein n=1 Tax=Drechslerella dactyloides TaxID=74499 RepID=A0AAD6NI29_DREDA|nr:hypothetical protein Dda_4592 [Drechslerella dactyloides]